MAIAVGGHQRRVKDAGVRDIKSNCRVDHSWLLETKQVSVFVGGLEYADAVEGIHRSNNTLCPSLA